MHFEILSANNSINLSYIRKIIHVVAQNVVLIQCMAQCWGNYSFALGLTFRRTLLGFYLHMVDGQPSGGCSGLGKRAGSGGQGAGAEAVPKMKLRLALKVSIESPASGFLEGLFCFALMV